MKYEKDNHNRLALFKELELNPEKVFGLKQIHSRNVLYVDSNNPPNTDADGMVTNDPTVCLSVTVADCLPVFLLDTRNKAFGIVHSGWKGTGIAVDALNLMKTQFGTNEQDVAAVLGPCIGACCYKVEEERAVFFEKGFGKKSLSQSRRDAEGKIDYYLDLRAANINLLQDAGVQNIKVCEDCTCCDERFGSFRREGEKFTRMIAMCGYNFIPILQAQ